MSSNFDFLVPKTFIQNLVQNGIVVSEKIRFDCFYVPDFFKKRSLFWSENLTNFVSGFFTLYAFIISKVIIRTQNYTNASLISAPVVISYQNV